MDIYENKDIKPMLLIEAEDSFNDPNYLFELKFDGTRTIIFAEPNKIVIKNKRGFILNNTYPELLKIKELVKNKCIFDGEIVLMVDGKPSFKKLQERALLKDSLKINYFKNNYPVTFICFDILYDKKNLTNLDLLERKKYLAKYKNNDVFVKTKYVLENGITFFEAAKNMDLEGIVAKEIYSKYKINQRSKEWIKIKNLKDEDFFIGGYQEDNKGYMASLVLGKLENKKLIYVGNVTIGKKNPEFIFIKHSKILKRSPFVDFEEANYTYISPKIKCTVLFMEKTKYNHLRQPIYKGLQLDN